MDYSDIIISQYQAAREMLRQTIARCPDSIWNSPDDKTRFWHIAYHALFYTHLYLQDSEQAFTPWAKHRKEYQFIGHLPWPPHSTAHRRIDGATWNAGRREDRLGRYAAYHAYGAIRKTRPITGTVEFLLWVVLFLITLCFYPL